MTRDILCVDDDLGVREILVGLIGRWGYNIECASNVAEAVEMFDAMNPFLVITDLKLQNHVDGATLADRLHRKDPLCIFIAITGLVDAFDLGYLLGAVFTDVLNKPVRSDILRKAIDYAWEKRQRWEQLLM